MNSHEFYLWLNGYLEALESEGLEVCKIKSIREKMKTIKTHNRSQERVIFGPPETKIPNQLDNQYYNNNVTTSNPKVAPPIQNPLR